MKKTLNSLIALTFALSTGCAKKAPFARAALPAPRVTTATVRLVPKAPLRARGRLWAASRRQLGFSSAGVVSRLRVDAGDRVRTGDVLAWLDNSEQTARLGAAAAGENLAERDLRDANNPKLAGAFTDYQRVRAQTSLHIAEAEVTQARAVLNKRVLVAPADGTVFKRLVTAGEVVDPGRPVLVIDETSQLVVDCGLVVSDVGRVHVGDRATVRVQEREIAAKVSSVASAPDDDGALYRVRVRLESSPNDIPLGLLVSLEFPDTAQGQAIQIGLAAVMNRNDRDYVFVVGERQGQSVATLRSVTLGRASSKFSEVLSGLTPDEQIVEEGGYFLRDGQPVRVAR